MEEEVACTATCHAALCFFSFWPLDGPEDFITPMLQMKDLSLDPVQLTAPTSGVCLLWPLPHPSFGSGQRHSEGSEVTASWV